MPVAGIQVPTFYHRMADVAAAVGDAAEARTVANWVTGDLTAALPGRSPCGRTIGTRLNIPHNRSRLVVR